MDLIFFLQSDVAFYVEVRQDLDGGHLVFHGVATPRIGINLG